MSDKWRYRFAGLLDRSKRLCWADLVSKVQRSPDYSWLPSSKSCRTGADFKRNGCCYCGKFQASASPSVPSSEGEPT